MKVKRLVGSFSIPPVMLLESSKDLRGLGAKTFNAMVRPVEELARRIIEKYGGTPWAWKPGTMRPGYLYATIKGASYEIQSPAGTERREERRELWFALNVCAELTQARRPDPEQARLGAWRAAVLATQAWAKLNYEDDIRTRRRHLKARQTSGRAANEKKKADSSAKHAEWLKYGRTLDSSLSKRWRCQRIGLRFGAKPETVRKALQKESW